MSTTPPESTPVDPTFRILLSYHYFRTQDMEALFAKLFKGGPHPEVFADSGAYSALTQGAPIDVHEYAAWLKQWGHLFHVYANLDVIGSGDQSAEGTWENQRVLEDQHGLNPLPVFHAGEPWSTLDRLLDHGYCYIALGGLVGRPPKAVMPWAIRAMQEAKGKAVFHGFGMTNWNNIATLPWYSVDSSSWGTGFRYGMLNLFDDAKSRFVTIRTNHSGIYDGDGARLIRSYGFDPAILAVRDVKLRPVICAISALSWQRAESFLRARHGAIDIPDGSRPPGLRWYCADAQPRNLGQGAEGLRMYLADAVPRDFRFLHEHRYLNQHTHQETPT